MHANSSTNCDNNVNVEAKFRWALEPVDLKTSRNTFRSTRNSFNKNARSIRYGIESTFEWLAANKSSFSISFRSRLQFNSIYISLQIQKINFNTEGLREGGRVYIFPSIFFSLVPQLYPQFILIRSDTCALLPSYEIFFLSPISFPTNLSGTRCPRVTRVQITRRKA